MINVNDISKRYVDKDILKNISFVLDNKEIVGLVGENGSGKTTLLKIIAGIINPDNGKVENQNENIGYLPQKIVFEDNETVKNFLIKKIGQDELYKIDTVLNKVGLGNLNQDKIANNLSGGEKTRIYIASLLVADPTPTTLLLDEPTNNLDVEGIDWLEKFLLNFQGNILLVSHDRSLLDNVCDKIFELHNGSIKSYGGNYSFYREQKEIELQAAEKMYIVQQKKIKAVNEDIQTIENRAREGEKRFGSRNPYQRRKIRKSAEQAVHRKNKLEKFLKSEKNLHKPEAKINYFISLSGEIHSDKSLIFIKNICKSFGSSKVLDDVTFHIGGKDRVWLAGLNGSGKTTLLKIITGEITQDRGEVEIGNDVNIGYFSQEKHDLSLENTILDEFVKIGLAPTDGYKLAISFGFKRDELHKKIKELSMGQKTKVAFAKLTVGNYQLLILDEPTNHLEISTREILEDALSKYNGGILVASHDRYFLEKIRVSKVISLSKN